MVIFTPGRFSSKKRPPLHPLKNTLGGTLSKSDVFLGNRKVSRPYGESKHDSLVIQSITYASCAIPHYSADLNLQLTRLMKVIVKKLLCRCRHTVCHTWFLNGDCIGSLSFEHNTTK